MILTSNVDPKLLRALSSPAMYRGHLSVTVHETHASWVLVASDRAYKIKKPVAMGFLDYSTLGLRRAACHEEVRVNAPLAHGFYPGVLAIARSGDGFRGRTAQRRRRGPATFVLFRVRR
jgi:aminoglycoside phosphotransferase family enzyme